jgi:hypothetical protein
MLAVMWQIRWGFIGSSLLRTLGSLAVLIVADFGSFYCDLSISSIVTFADSVIVVLHLAFMSSSH